MIFETCTDLVGKTPIVKLNSKNSDKFIKLEGLNPTGAIKDRLAFGLIKNKIEQGLLTKGMTLIGASGGSFGCSLSYFGKLLGFNTKIVVNDKMKDDKREFIKYFGGELIDYPGSTIDGNEHCKELAAEAEDLLFFDQFHDWENVNVHYSTTGLEIIDDLPNIGTLIFSVGTGGSLYGISKRLAEFNSDIKIVAVTGSSGTKISGLYTFDDGDYVTPFYKEFLSSGLISKVEKVSEVEAISGLFELRDKGFYTGICSGAVYAALKRQECSSDSPILMISGDSGWKNSDYISNLVND